LRCLVDHCETHRHEGTGHRWPANPAETRATSLTGDTAHRSLSRGHSTGCCLKSTVRQIRRNWANPQWKGAWHLAALHMAALRVPGSGGTWPTPSRCTWSSGDTSQPATYPGAQRRVLPEISSPSDPSQLGKSALQKCMAPGRGTLQRCMAPGCVEVSRLRWNLALPKSLYLAVRGHTTAGDLPGDTAAGVARNQQSVRSVAIGRIRNEKVHGTWLR
jgi:hypothetical protein